MRNSGLKVLAGFLDLAALSDLHIAHGFGISVLDRGMDIEADVLLTR